MSARRRAFSTGPRPRATCSRCGWTGPVRMHYGTPSGRLWQHSSPDGRGLCLWPYYDRSTLTRPEVTR